MAEGFIATRVEINDNLPAAATNLQLSNSPLNGAPRVSIQWTNPTSNFAGVLVVRKAGSIPTSVWDGETAYDGTGTSFVDTAVAFDTTYYYRAYPYNLRRQYQTTSAVASVTPKEGKQLSRLPVGGLVKLKQRGAEVLYLIVQKGRPSSVYDSSCDGIWLMMKDCYENRQWHSSDLNDYAASTIHNYLNNAFLSLFESNVQAAIKQIKLPYRAGAGYHTTTTGGANGLPTKIFLLSGKECAFVHSFIPPDEGEKLSYFADCIVNERDEKRIAKLNGSAVEWWLRSPCCAPNIGSTGVSTIYKTGSRFNSYGSHLAGVRPTFILPADFLLKPIANSDGSYSPLDE